MFGCLEVQSPKDRRPYVKQWRWWLGLVMVILGAIGDFVAFAFGERLSPSLWLHPPPSPLFVVLLPYPSAPSLRLCAAPASIVTPVGSFTLVTNIVFAHCWLGEALSKRDFIGTGLIVSGATIAVAFGDHTTECYEISELQALWERTPVFVYLAVVVGLLVAMYLTVRAAERVLTKAATNDADAPTTPVLVADVDPPAAYDRFARWHPLCYAGLAGVLGAQTVLFAKSTAEILKVTFDGDNQFDKVLTYVILVCMFFTIFSQQHWLATGLQFFDALYIVPVFQAFFIGVSVIAGGGACVLLCGVCACPPPPFS